MNVFTALIEPMRDRPCIVRSELIRKPAQPKVKKRKPVPYVSTPWNLTPMQCQVVPLMTEGYTAKEIGELLGGLSFKTVEIHMMNARQRMNARSNVVAAVMYDRWIRQQA